MKKKNYDTYISYSRSDNYHFAIEVYDRLIAMNFTPFLDTQCLGSDHVSIENLKLILEQVENVISLRSTEDYVPSSFEEKELKLAKENKKNIIPFYDEGMLPGDLDIQAIKYSLEYREAVFEKLSNFLYRGSYYAGERFAASLDNIEYVFRYCPRGTAKIGASKKEEFDACRYDWDYNEYPGEVDIERGFWLLETPVTQEMWHNIMGSHLRKMLEHRQCPVTHVSWEQCIRFCMALSRRGLPVRLPSEVQWEYACRAETTTPYNFGYTLNGDKANCDGDYPFPREQNKGESCDMPTNVFSYPPNLWGLYDMHGNVWEWCQDCYRENCVEESACGNKRKLSASVEQRPSRTIRGGSWDRDAGYCRSASRWHQALSNRRHYVGFRVAILEPGEKFNLELSTGTDLVFKYCPVSPVTHSSKRDSSHTTDLNLFGAGNNFGSFWILESPVTAKIWNGVMLQSQVDIEDCYPVTNMNAQLAADFCRELSEQILNIVPETLRSELPSELVRLPTSSQWEYACKAKHVAKECSDLYEKPADDNAPMRDVKGDEQNSWGLYAMKRGGILELCTNNASVELCDAGSEDATSILRGGVGCPDCAKRLDGTINPSLIGFRVVLPEELVLCL